MGKKGHFLIVGVGNTILSDDGIGVHIVKKMEEEKQFKSAEYLDMGTSSMELGYYIGEDTEKMVIIDCIRSDEKPGTIYKLTPEDLAARKRQDFSLHQLKLIDTLKLISLDMNFPETIIVGIVPDDVETFSETLSARLKADFQNIYDRVVVIIREFLEN